MKDKNKKILNAYILFKFLFEREKDNRWVGVCEELGVSNYGNTIEEAQEHLEESVDLHIKSLIELGEFGNMIAKYKIPFYLNKPKEITLSFDEKNGDDFFIRLNWYNIHNISNLSEERILESA
jgi:predicted RNase H-like HicB family nuclease